MSKEIDSLLVALDIKPVLVDIGASGQPPDIWNPIASHSVYVGFDPDLRALQDIPDGQYLRSVIINKAVTSKAGQNEVLFYLTRSPYCSSTLPPDSDALDDYLFSNLFEVDKQISMPASTLSTELSQLGLKGVDWFKTDSQGTDLRLFRSLNELGNRLLAVDIEPGLIDAYQGEDLFVDAHRALVTQGFWLSTMEVKGSVRMKRTTLEAIRSNQPALKDSDISHSVCTSPGWCEARYLRTLDSLLEQDSSIREFVLLWVFAMIDNQWGYALDIAQSYAEKFGADKILVQLRNAPLRQIIAHKPKASFLHLFKQHLKKLLPAYRS